MEKYYCPICGYELKEEFSIGIICPCCGNESGFEDDILFDELKEFSSKDFKVAKVDKDELIRKSIEPIPIKIAYRLLASNNLQLFPVYQGYLLLHLCKNKLKHINEIDTDFILKTLDHIKVYETGKIIIRFMDGTVMKCNGE